MVFWRWRRLRLLSLMSLLWCEIMDLVLGLGGCGRQGHCFVLLPGRFWPLLPITLELLALLVVEGLLPGWFCVPGGCSACICR